MSLTPLPLRAIVQSLDDQSVQLKLEDGQTLRLPRAAVEGTPKVGQDVRLLAVAIGADDAGRTVFAKAILGELIGTPLTP